MGRNIEENKEEEEEEEDTKQKPIKHKSYQIKHQLNKVINIFTALRNLNTFKVKLKPCWQKAESKDAIYKNSSYQERQSIIYLWFELNLVRYRSIKPKHQRRLSTIGIKTIEQLNLKKTLDWKLNLYCICKRLVCDLISQYLYFSP